MAYREDDVILASLQKQFEDLQRRYTFGEAAAHLGEYRLTDTSIYITLEPCVMCVGAILNARIAQVYYGARDEKAGALGSVYDIGRDGLLNHRVEVYGGILGAECARVLRDFFESRRAIKGS